MKLQKIIFFACLAFGASMAYAVGEPQPAPGTGGLVKCTPTQCFKGCTVCDRGPTGSCRQDPQCRGASVSSYGS